MAPNTNHPKLLTRSLGHSEVTEDTLKEMVSLGEIAAGAGRAPAAGETSVLPEADEVIVFQALFTAGLRFPLDPVMVDVLRMHRMYLYQFTPNSMAHLSLYFWLTKTS